MDQTCDMLTIATVFKYHAIVFSARTNNSQGKKKKTISADVSLCSILW